MSVKVTQVNQTVNPAEIPDGTYEGNWSGYTVTFQVGGKNMTATTEVGFRGLSVACDVVVSMGTVTVEQKQS